MEALSADRFKEEGYTLRGLVEEIYLLAREGKAEYIGSTLKEAKRIKDALEYKEREVKSTLKGGEVEKEEVEELAKSLSAVKVSPASLRLLELCKERERIHRISVCIKYIDLVSGNNSSDNINNNSGNDTINGSNNISDNSGNDTINNNREWISIAEFISLAEQAGLNEQVSKWKSLLSKKAEEQCMNRDIEEAKKGFQVLLLLGKRRAAVDALAKRSSKTEEYIHSIVSKVDLINGIESRSFREYASGLPNRVSMQLTLAEPILGEAEIVQLFGRVSADAVRVLREDIRNTNDPFEYLHKAEVLYVHIEEMKQEAAAVAPAAGVGIRRYDVLKLDKGVFIQKESEGIKNLLDLFFNGEKGRVRYTVQGEEICTPLSSNSLFQYLAVCRKGLVRAMLLGYSAQEIEQITEIQLAGHSLILSRLWKAKGTKEAKEKKELPCFSFFSAHSALYLCIKKMYRVRVSMSGRSIGAGIERALEVFSKAEEKRNTIIFSQEKEDILKEMQKCLERKETQEIMKVITEAFKPLGGSLLLDSATESVLKDHIKEIEKYALERRDKKEVEETYIYFKEIRRAVKALSLVSLRKDILRIGKVIEALISEDNSLSREDLTDKSISQVQKARRRQSKG